MRFPSLRLAASALVLGAALCLPAAATPVMDISPELLLAQANELKLQLRLNANQQTLWTQATGKAQALLRGRQQRRERLQQDLLQALGGPDAELRKLNKAVEDEADVSAAENRQLRELLLTVSDALDDSQRRTAQAFLLESLQRREGPEGAPQGEGRARGAPSGGHGRGRGGPGGMGGMGGGMGGPGNN